MADGEKSVYKDWYKFTDFEKHVPVEDYFSDEDAYLTVNANKARVIYNAMGGI